MDFGVCGVCKQKNGKPTYSALNVFGFRFIFKLLVGLEKTQPVFVAWQTGLKETLKLQER